MFKSNTPVVPAHVPAPPLAPLAIAPARDESRGQRLLRDGRRARLYTWAVVALALFVVLVGLIAANVRSVKLDWVFGSTHASLIWIILAAAVLGWLLGIATSVLFRYRTRRPSACKGG
jgi:uncharacterized integral membrane protein